VGWEALGTIESKDASERVGEKPVRIWDGLRPQSMGIDVDRLPATCRIMNPAQFEVQKDVPSQSILKTAEINPAHFFNKNGP
jgi:hypothetical protein